MNSVLVLSAYFAMLLSPCVVAQWGDLLSSRWIGALMRRRRTHRAESFLVSLRHERYAMALALEASFAASTYEQFNAPKPFLVRKAPAPVETAAFLDARQRVAARLTQLAVAQKLRNAAEAPSKIVALPPDVPAPALDATHIRPRKQTPVVYEPAEREPAYGFASMGVPPSLVTSPAFAHHGAPQRHELAANAAVTSPSTSHRGLEAVPPRQRDEESSGALEAAA